MNNNLLMVIYIIGVIVTLFLIGRFVVLWYFRINKICSLLEEIRDSLVERVNQGIQK